jgi:hypothetical protein
MSMTHRWVDTHGGFHLLLADELLHYWRGIEGWYDHADPNDQSDYARASRVTTYVGAVPCQAGTAMVLGGDVGLIAWMPSLLRNRGFLVQWLYADDEQSIESVVKSATIANLLEGPDTETIKFNTGPSGRMWLFDSAYAGDELPDDSELLRLEPGDYRMRANYFESKALAIVVREIARI